MDNNPIDQQRYATYYCRDCPFLKVLYQLEEDQYQFGCDNQLTCKYVKEEEND